MRRALPSLLVAALAGCGRTPADAPDGATAVATRSPSEAALIEHGRKVYNFRCYFCHGYSGDARTLAATYLTPPPRDFSAASSATLPRSAIDTAVREGRAGTAMKSFAGILNETELQAVAAFVEREFVRGKAHNTAYHTPENGWPDHARFAAAFAFATGDMPLDTPWENLTPRQAAGKRLFLSTCVTCHDRARVSDEGPTWTSRPLSYPRAGFVLESEMGAAPKVDAVSGASAYAIHDVVPRIAQLSATQKRGESLYAINCAFCHAADGTGKNWIGRFMEPPARDLTMFSAATMPPPRLVSTIRDGLTGTSMPAWSDVLRGDEIDAIADYVVRAFFGTENGEAHRARINPDSTLPEQPAPTAAQPSPSLRWLPADAARAR